MSNHDDGMAAAFAVHAAHHGDTDNVTVTPATGAGDPATVTAVVGPEVRTEVTDDEGGRRLRVERLVLVSSDDVAAIGARAQLTISSVTYSVDGVPQDCGAFWRVTAVRFGSMEKRRRRYTDEF